MKKIDRLLLKMQEARRVDDMALCVAFIKAERGGVWSVSADLWNGINEGLPDSKTQRVTMEFDTLEEAEEAVHELEAEHKPIGRVPEPVVIII